jgi:hypothetical protein
MAAYPYSHTEILIFGGDISDVTASDYEEKL